MIALNKNTNFIIAFMFNFVRERYLVGVEAPERAIAL